MRTLLILGATGQVGQELLRLALGHPEVGRVIAPTRRRLPPDPKLENPIVDFDSLPTDAPEWQADIALCALGTTRRQAGSRKGFYHVDHDLVLGIATMCRKTGIPVFGLVSSLGANTESKAFYLRVKGDTERDLQTLGFPSLILIRPSLLVGGSRSISRPLEAFGHLLASHLALLLPARYRPVSTRAVARTLLAASLIAQPGLQIIESEGIPDELAD